MRVLTLMLIWLGVALGPTAHAQSAPSEVTVGMYINDIQAVDLTTHSYSVDFYIWFRWQDRELDPIATFELMNKFDPEASVRQDTYDEPQPQPDGSLYNIVRYQGAFSSKFPLMSYPFDSQDLLVTVEDSDAGADAVRFVPDENPIVLNPRVRLPGYDIGTPALVIEDYPYETFFGDLAETEVSAYSRASFIVPISRPWVSGLFKSMIPILLIILSAAFALLLDPEHVEARIGLAITALLTLVAMQFTMLSGLPEIAYLTLLDQLYLVSYLYILVVIGIVVRGTRIDQRGEIQSEKTSSKNMAAISGPRVAITVTSGYLAIVLAIVWSNLATN